MSHFEGPPAGGRPGGQAPHPRPGLAGHLILLELRPLPVLGQHCSQFYPTIWMLQCFFSSSTSKCLSSDGASHIWVTISWRDIIPKTVLFFQSLTVNFSYMVHCREPNLFPVALNYLLAPGNVFFVTIILDRGPMLLWGKM